MNQFFLNDGTETCVVGLLPDTLPSPPTKIYGTVVLTALEVTDATFQLSISVTLNPPTVAPHHVIDIGLRNEGSLSGRSAGVGDREGPAALKIWNGLIPISIAVQ